LLYWTKKGHFHLLHLRFKSHRFILASSDIYICGYFLTAGRIIKLFFRQLFFFYFLFLAFLVCAKKVRL